MDKPNDDEIVESLEYVPQPTIIYCIVFLIVHFVT